MRPPSTTMMRSAICNIEPRWVTKTQVMPFVAASSEATSACSVPPSSAAVGSSSNNTAGFEIRARAIANDWRMPADSSAPRSLRRKSKPPGSVPMKSAEPEACEASRRSWSVASGAPMSKFSRTEPENMTGFWKTMDMFWRKSSGWSWRTSALSTSTEPLSGFTSPMSKRKIVVLPVPMRPKMATRSPAAMSKLTLLSVGCSPPS